MQECVAMSSGAAGSSAIAIIAAMITPALLILGSASLERHALRARYAERSIALFYAAVVLFIATCLQIQEEIRQASKRLEDKSP
jgi:hypothetical protein